MSERQLSTCSHRWLHSACKKCGIHYYSGDCALKTNLFDSFLNCSPIKYLKNLRKRQYQPIQANEISQSTALLLDAICEKFEYGMETRALGMYIFRKVCGNQESNQKFWTSVCLMAASKGIQLDKRVPYLNRYQRYADISFSQQDYELAQKMVFEGMKFNIQFTTLSSFLDYYLTIGIVFYSDNLSNQEVQAIEDELVLKTKILVRQGNFLKYEPEKLTISLIKQIRAKYQLQPWNSYLESISGIKSEDIREIKKIENSELLGAIKLKNIQKSIQLNLSNSYQLEASNVLTSIENIIHTAKQTKVTKNARQNYENSLRIQRNLTTNENCIKQNTNRMLQPLSSNLKDKKYQVRKVPLTFSTDRLMPTNMFASKR